MRIGIGYDIHPLVEGRKLILGGVEIDFPRGLKGHSDADVLSHAVCDALLGAAGLGDIGRHFPDNDEEYRGISSLKLLERAAGKVREKGFFVENVDVTVILEKPKISPQAGLMAEKVAAAIGTEPSRVNIKATTNEKLDAVGRGEAIAAYAAACLKEGGV